MSEYKDETVIKIMTLRSASLDGWSQARASSENCRKYLCHEHYTDDQKALAAELKKPLLTYNMILSKILTIQGNETVNRRVSKIIARFASDVDAANILSENYACIADNENLEDKLNLIHIDALSLRIGGYINRRLDLDEFGYLGFKYDVLDPFDVHPDPDFKEFDMSDADYVAIDAWMTLDQIKANYRVEPGTETSKWWFEVKNKIDKTASNTADNPMTKIGNKYLVVELQEREIIECYLCAIDGDDLYEKLSEEDIIKLRKLGHEIEVITSIIDSRIFITTIVPHLDVVVMRKQFPFPTSRFSIFPCFSYNLNIQKSKQSSLLQVLIDIQDRVNKGMSQQVDYVTQALGAPWHVSQNERAAIKALEEKGNLPNAVIKYISIANKAIREPAPTVPSAILQTVGTDVEFMNEISNITPALQGKSEKSSETGVLYDKKLRESQISTNSYYEIKAKTRELLANDYVELAPYVYFEDERPLPVKKEHGAIDYIMANLEINGVKYNEIRSAKAKARLDEGDSTESALEKNLNENMAVVASMLQSGATFMDIPWAVILQNSPIKDKKKWIDFIAARQNYNQNVAEQKMADEQFNTLMTHAKSNTTT